MTYDLISSHGSVIGRARSSEAAHRATRRTSLVGSHVNLAKGPKIVDDHVTGIVDPKWRFSFADPRLVFKVTTYVTGRSLADAKLRAERYGEVWDVSIIQLAEGHIAQAIAAREEDSIEAVDRTTKDATHYLVHEPGGLDTVKTTDRNAWLKSLRNRPKNIKAADWRDFMRRNPNLARVKVHSEYSNIYVTYIENGVSKREGPFSGPEAKRRFGELGRQPGVSSRAFDASEGRRHGVSLNRAGLSRTAKGSAMVRGMTFADYEAQARARQPHPTQVSIGRQTLAMTPGGTVMMERPNFAGSALTKRQVVSAMRKAGIVGEVRGRGSAWEVELPDERAKNAFQKHVTRVGGFKTGYGAWILRPGYKSMGEWGDPGSRWHY